MQRDAELRQLMKTTSSISRKIFIPEITIDALDPTPVNSDDAYGEDTEEVEELEVMDE